MVEPVCLATSSFCFCIFLFSAQCQPVHSKQFRTRISIALLGLYSAWCGRSPCLDISMHYSSNHGDISDYVREISIRGKLPCSMCVFYISPHLQFVLNCVRFSAVCFTWRANKQKLLLWGEMANTEHVVLGTTESYRELFNAWDMKKEWNNSGKHHEQTDVLPTTQQRWASGVGNGLPELPTWGTSSPVAGKHTQDIRWWRNWWKIPIPQEQTRAVP